MSASRKSDSNLRWLRSCLAGAAALGLSVVAVAEAVHWRAARQGFPAPPPARGRAEHDRERSEAVIVLGCPSQRNGRIHPLQKWRTEIGVRSRDPRAPRSVLIFTGFARPGERSEAAVMGAYADDVLGVRSSEIVLEEEARNTWENIGYSIPLVEDVDVIKMASNSLHAWKGRVYLRRQRPDLADRLVPADDYRVGERWWLKPLLVAYSVTRRRMVETPTGR